MRDKDQLAERLKNPPMRLTEAAKQIKQVPFRLHMNDYNALRKLLDEDGWKFQRLVEAVVEAYIRRDPLLIKLLVEWKEENVIPRRIRDDYTLSSRERKDVQNILDEFDDD